MPLPLSQAQCESSPEACVCWGLWRSCWLQAVRLLRGKELCCHWVTLCSSARNTRATVLILPLGEFILTPTQQLPTLASVHLPTAQLTLSSLSQLSLLPACALCPAPLLSIPGTHTPSFFLAVVTHPSPSGALTWTSYRILRSVPSMEARNTST